MAREPNEKLMRWQEAAGLSNTGLARRVCIEGEATGHPHVRPDATSVRSWRAGTRPRDPAPQIIAAVFTRHLGYIVSAADLGFEHTGPPLFNGLDLPWAACRTVEALAVWTKADFMLPSRRMVLNDFAGVAVGAALLGPLQTGLKKTPAGLSGQKAGTPIGMDHVAEIERTTAFFRNTDNRIGGGGAHRKALLGHLTDAHELLSSATYNAPVGRRLRIAVADACSLVGWSAFDQREHQTAQRYWILGLHAAHDADDPGLTGWILYEMARQMNHLDRSNDALDLLQMAHHGTYQVRSPQLHAQINASLAGAYARLGLGDKARQALDLAREDLAAPLDEPVPDRLVYVTDAALAGGRGDVLRRVALHEQGKKRTVTLGEALDNSVAGIDGMNDPYVRTRARYLANAVDALTIAREYDQATTVAARMADAIGPVHSPRTEDDIRTTRSRLGRNPKDPKARALVEHLTRSLRPRVA